MQPAHPEDDARREGPTPLSAPLTVALVVINVAVFALEFLWSDVGGGDTLYRMGAIVAGAPEFYRVESVLAYGYLHLGVLHLGMNMWALYNLGRVLEPMLGAAAFFVLYTLAIAGGGAAITLFGEASVTAGASGGLFGLLGAVAVLLFVRARVTRDPSERARVRSSLMGLLLPNLLISLLPGVSFLGHAGGFAIGLAYVGIEILALRARHGAPRRKAAELGLTVAAGALALLTFAAIAHLWLDLRPWAA